MKYAIFSDDFLSYFRLDDNGETLVLTDKRGYTRAVKLLPYEERPYGEWIEKQETPTSISYYCSNCEHIGLGFENFCAWCGAEMRGKEE